MKKSLISIFVITCLFVACLFGTLITPTTYVKADSNSNNQDINVNFDDYSDVKFQLGDSNTLFGNDKWEVNFCNESCDVQILSDPTGAGMGKVLRMDNSPTGSRPSGSYTHVTYDEENYSARNFTVSYDFYNSKGTDTSWAGVYVRTDDASINANAMKTVLLFFQKGKGTGSEQVPLSDGSSRPSTKNDIYLQYQPFYSFGSGLSQMRDESGKSKDHGRFFATDGGDLQGKWLSVKFQVRGNYFYSYIKEKNETEWTQLETGYLNDASGKITLGSISLGTCGGEYYFDNFNVINEDATELIVESKSPAQNGTAFTRQETVGNNTDIELIMQPRNGYVWGKWFKDAALTEEITPTSFEVQQKVYNSMGGYYEWKKVDDVTITSFADYDEIAPNSDQNLTIKEYYSGENYRIVVYVNSSNGSTYYGEIEKRAYSLEIYADGQGEFTVSAPTESERADFYLEKYNIGEKVTLKSYPDANKVFAGWYKIVTENDQDYKIKLSENEEYEYTTEYGGSIIQALFLDSGIAKHTININTTLSDGDSADYGEVIAGNGSFYYGEEISLIAKPKAGYSFVSWMIDEQTISTSEYYNFTVEEDVTVTAVFEIEKYRIFISDGLGTENVKVVEASTQVTLTAPIAPIGYEFSSWRIDGVEDFIQDQVNRKVTFQATSKNITATAVYIAKTYKVTLSSSDVEQGIVLGTGQYAYGDKVTIVARPKTGFSVSNLTVRGAEIIFEENGTYSFIMPDNAVIVRVTFTPIDNVNVNKELIAYIIFGSLIVVVTVAFLFVRKKKD